MAQDSKKILLINFGGIGDEILFFPVVSSLKKKFPESEITLALEPRSACAVELNDNINNVLKIDVKGKNKYFELLKLYFSMLLGRFDIVISSGANPLIPVLLFFSGIKIRIGFKSSKTSKLLTTAVELNKEQYASCMYHDLVSELTGEKCEKPFIKVEQNPKEPNTVLVHPGVSKMSVIKGMQKTFEPEKWAQIVIELLNRGKKVYLAGGKDDIEVLNKIREYLKDKDKTNFVDLASKGQTLKEFAQKVSEVEVLLCSDSAPMHIGVGVNTKTVAIFGATDEKKLLPLEPQFIAVTNANCECRPCLWHKRQTTCAELKCLNISCETVLDNLKY